MRALSRISDTIRGIRLVASFNFLNTCLFRLISEHRLGGLGLFCRRLGMGKNGSKAIIKHPWFSSMDWMKLEKQQLPAPFVPDIRDDFDVSNFDEVDDENMHKGNCGPCEDKILCAPFPMDDAVMLFVLCGLGY